METRVHIHEEVLGFDRIFVKELFSCLDNLMICLFLALLKHKETNVP
jgi:hypothetical protein